LDTSQKPSLLIGGCSSYGWNEVKNWVLSAKKFAPHADIVLCASNVDGASVKRLLDEGVKMVVHEYMSQLSPHVQRFVFMHDYLQKNQNYDYVIATDVKDVVFQSDPFQELAICGANLICGSEGLRYQDEEWGNTNLLQTFGPHFHAQWKRWEIFNVGVLGGTFADMSLLLLQIFITSISRPVSICDQAVFNYLVNYTGLQYSVHFSSPEDEWVVHAGTLADPRKIDKFRPNLMYREPQFGIAGRLDASEKNVLTYAGLPYAIVHQYDRVPEWKEHFEELYSE
jgi:hypothetical protein